MRLLNEPLIAVRIPRFHSQGKFGSHVNFAIIVERPGATHTLTKRYSEFQQLHEELGRRPFAASLPPLPPYRAFANFDAVFLEKRRQLLEAYVSFLCIHSLVLLDSALWTWLALDGGTQVAVCAAVLHSLGRETELASCIMALEAVLLAGLEETACCLHPAVLAALRATLRSEAASEEALCAACRILQRLLQLRRARQLFLPRAAGGVAALLAVHRRGGAAAEAAQRVFEHLCDGEGEAEDADEVEGAALVGARSRMPKASEVGEAGPGECCICLDRGKSHAFLPCGHLCACMDCSAFMSARGSPCPICRRPIERSAQIFL